MPKSQKHAEFPAGDGLGMTQKRAPRKFKAEATEMQGQKLFFGKARCDACNPTPYYTTIHART